MFKRTRISTGLYEWKISLKFKIGNFQKLLLAVQKLLWTVKSTHIQMERKSKSRNQKDQRRIITWLTNWHKLWFFISCEWTERNAKLDEEKNPDWNVIDVAMDSTCSARGKEIVDEPPVSEIRNRCPAFFTYRQVSLCFNVNLFFIEKQTFGYTWIHTFCLHRMVAIWLLTILQFYNLQQFVFEFHSLV